MIPNGPCWIINAKYAISVALLEPADGSFLTSKVSSESMAMVSIDDYSDLAD
jgi:hypothetical protein